VKITQGPQVSLTGINHIPALRTVGRISNIGVHPYGASIVSPATYGLGSITGLHSIGGLRQYNLGHLGLGHLGLGHAGLGHAGLSTYGLGSYGLGSYGLGLNQVAVRPAAVNYLSAYQPAVHQVAVAQPGISTVVAQPAAVQTVAVAQPGLYSQTYATQQNIVPVSAAVTQVGRTVEYRPVPYSDQPIVPQVVEVEPSDIPIHIHFKSRSSTVQLSQEHIPGAPGTVEQTSSQDEPSKVIHEVVKPVIQEVREVIQPYRQLSQEIQPVVENVHTVVAKGEGERKQFVAQHYVPQTVQTVEAVQPVAQYQTVTQQIARPIVQAAHYQTIAQPLAQIQAVAQPVSQYQTNYQTVAQPYGIAQLQAYRSIAQPVVSTIGAVAQPVYGVAQTYKSIAQPSVYAIQQQPIASILGAGSLLNSGVYTQDITKQVGLGGVSFLSARSQPHGSISYSRTYTENDRK
jgi:hypothetical protein